MFLIWEFPKDALDAFTEITILTYLFEGSTLCAYLNAHAYPYQNLGITGDGHLILRDQVNEALAKARVRQLLTVYEGPKNEIGAYRQKGSTKLGCQKFTVTNLSGLEPDAMKRIAGTVTKFVERDAQHPRKDIGWTTFKEFKDRLRGKHYSNETAFIPVNARASNDW